MGRRNRVGRKHNPEAKRNQTTREGQGRVPGPGTKCGCCGLPTSLTVRRRLALTGADDLGEDFPLDALLRLGFITQAEHDEGMRFAALAWSLYGAPFAGTEKLYERMISGVVDGEYGPRREAAADDEARATEMARMVSNGLRYERMADALKALKPYGVVFETVRRATQFLVRPKFVLRATIGEMTDEEFSEFTRLRRGLKRLVKETGAEDRHISRITASRRIEPAPPP